MTDEEAGVGSFAAHCEGYGIALALPFKVGDKVRVVKLRKQSPDDSLEHFDNALGMEGTVVRVDTPWTVCPYMVDFPTENKWNTNRPVYPNFFAEEELELAE